MTNVVEFPGLGISLEISRVAFTIFGMPIYWYGICIGLGMLLAVVFAFTQAKSFGIDSDRMIDVIIVGLVTAIIGGRLYYVLFVDQQYTTLWEILDIRSGGIAIYGGIIGAFIGAFFACKWRKVAILPMFDLTGMGFLIGQALGRWGNFFNQEAFGSNTTLPWGMKSTATQAYLSANYDKLLLNGIQVDPSMPVHPTFLYESLWCALGFLLLFLYRKHRRFHGELFLFYIIWYGLGRFFIEGLRTDSLFIGGNMVRVSQLLAGLSVLAALGLWFYLRVRTGKAPLVIPEIPPRTAKVKVKTDEGIQKVEISWPAGPDDPSKAEKQKMALEILEKQKARQQEKLNTKDGYENLVQHLAEEEEQEDAGEDH